MIRDMRKSQIALGERPQTPLAARASGARVPPPHLYYPCYGTENCFSYPFSDFPIKRKERESKDRFLGVEIRFWISRFIANPKSGFQNLNLNPNRKRP